MNDIWKTLSIIAQIVAYILAVIVIVQIIRLVFGGSWEKEDIILALLTLTITLVFGIMGYLININNRISKVERMIYGHIQWHKGINSKF